jgi:hypothetical protein
MVTPNEIRWEILPAADDLFNSIRKKIKAEAYDAGKVALKQLLCAYFNSESGKNCDKKSGKTIAPVGSRTGKGGKCLKVRWLVPGQGKSGGMRIAVVAYCEAKHVKLAAAWLRKDDPGDHEFADAVKSA